MWAALVAVAANGFAAEVLRVIFDTDMYTDYDDVGALAILHTLADVGECEIIAVGSNTWGEGNKSVATCEIINTYYGRPDIPVGCARSGGRQGPGDAGYGLPEKYAHFVRHAFTNWPADVPITFVDFPIGRHCYAGRAVAELPDTANPVRDAFRFKMTPRHKVEPGKSRDQLAGHPSWDEIAALVAVLGVTPLFTLQRGFHRMVGTDGTNAWTDDPQSPHGRVTFKAPPEAVGRALDELMCRPPTQRRELWYNMPPKNERAPLPCENIPLHSAALHPSPSAPSSPGF